LKAKGKQQTDKNRLLTTVTVCTAFVVLFERREEGRERERERERERRRERNQQDRIGAVSKKA
jgi:hypothetical protein